MVKQRYATYADCRWQTGRLYIVLPIPSLIANINNLTEVLFWLTGVLVWLTEALVWLRAQLYGLGYPRQPSPRATLAEVTFSLFLSKIEPAVYIRIANSSRGARQLGWASCLTSAGRVTLASGTTFLHINALARLTGTSLGVANVT